MRLGIRPAICMQVLDAVLNLINSLVAADASALNALCLVGILPAVFRLSAPSQSRPLRRKAALFQHVCCHSSTLMLRMVVICQVFPFSRLLCLQVPVNSSGPANNRLSVTGHAASCTLLSTTLSSSVGAVSACSSICLTAAGL